MRIAWFRRDLRLSDNPIVDVGGDRTVPLFVLDPRLFRPGTPRTDELVRRLAGLDAALAERGGRLRVESGRPEDVVPAVAQEVGADVVDVNLDVSPYARDRDAAVADRVELDAHWGTLVHPPNAVRTSEDKPYRVFTPFHRAWSALDVRPAAEPDFSPTADVGDGLPDVPGDPVGEAVALGRLGAWSRNGVDGYRETRDRPDLDATSRLSIDLKYGSVSPTSIVRAVGEATADRAAFVRQVAWREFYAQLLWHHPETLSEPLNERFAAFPWRDAPDDLARWEAGRTGVPIVDAGMRQLVGSGWMHNRVRMVTGSFLVKHLLIHWAHGERFFRRHLLDGDVPQNVGNWQWVAGTGADAAPYFRVFNPVLQGRRFDPDGDYVRRWVPELADVDTDHIHAPWELGPLEREALDYPDPVIDVAAGRDRALAAYDEVKG
jgi:deoxyribodipyrimidine photo-lyase